MFLRMAVDKEQIRELALKCGFSECGVTSVEPFLDYEAELRSRASADRDASGRYLQMMPRARPGERMKWANSIIVCIRRYGKYSLPEPLVGHIGRNYLCDCRREGCPDNGIDDRFQEGLKELGIRYKKGSVPDRAAAVRAGAVRMGRNNFAYSQTGGSWVNIETWVIDAELEPDEPTPECPCPEGCTACQNACPTGALHGPYQMKMSKCIPYLTYSAPEPFDEELWRKMQGWVYGCDMCQLACPMNKGKWEELEEMHWLDKWVDKLTPDALLNMDYDTYRNIVHPRFWYIKLDNMKRWQRNAKRAVDWLNRGKEKGQT